MCRMATHTVIKIMQTDIAVACYVIVADESYLIQIWGPRYVRLLKKVKMAFFVKN